MDNIKRVSKYLRLFLLFLFIATPLLTAIGWSIAPQPIAIGGPLAGFNFEVVPHFIPIMHPLTAMDKFYGFLVSLIPLTANLAVLYFLIKLFSHYEEGKIFLMENVLAIKRTGISLLAYQLLIPVYQAIISPILTWHNPPGHRMSVASFSGTNVGLVFTALIIILVSWIMAEGCKLREEQQLTI